MCGEKNSSDLIEVAPAIRRRWPNDLFTLYDLLCTVCVYVLQMIQTQRQKAPLIRSTAVNWSRRKRTQVNVTLSFCFLPFTSTTVEWIRSCTLSDKQLVELQKEKQKKGAQWEQVVKSRWTMEIWHFCLFHVWMWWRLWSPHHCTAHIWAVQRHLKALEAAWELVAFNLLQGHWMPHSQFDLQRLHPQFGNFSLSLCSHVMATLLQLKRHWFDCSSLGNSGFVYRSGRAATETVMLTFPHSLIGFQRSPLPKMN